MLPRTIKIIRRMSDSAFPQIIETKITTRVLFFILLFFLLLTLLHKQRHQRTLNRRSIKERQTEPRLLIFDVGLFECFLQNLRMEIVAKFLNLL